MTTLFAFLGTNNYVPVHYRLDDRTTVDPEAFTQAALIQLLDPAPTRLVLAVTAAASGKSKSDREPGESNLDRLLRRLDTLGFSRDAIDQIEIPDGASEDELWQIFQKLADIGTGEIVFDCTHGFRTLPLIATLALPFHGSLRSFRIARVLYGAFEVLGTPRDVKADIDRSGTPAKIAPIFDLTAMLDIPIWHQAINEFRNHGRARGLEDRLNGPTSQLGRQLGKLTPPELRNLPRLLSRLSDLLSVTKVDEVGASAADVDAILDKAARQLELHPLTFKLRPFATIVEELRDIIKPLVPRATDSPGEFAVRMARWYIEREQFASAYTTMRETVTDHVVRIASACGIESVAAGLPDSPKGYRSASSRFRITVDGWFFRHASGNELRELVDTDAITKLCAALDRTPGLLDAARPIVALNERRNRLNHAFKGEAAATKIERNRDTGRLWLHQDAHADLGNVQRFIAIQAVPVTPPSDESSRQ